MLRKIATAAAVTASLLIGGASAANAAPTALDGRMWAGAPIVKTDPNGNSWTGTDPDGNSWTGIIDGNSWTGEELTKRLR